MFLTFYLAKCLVYVNFLLVDHVNVCTCGSCECFDRACGSCKCFYLQSGTEQLAECVDHVNVSTCSQARSSLLSVWIM